MSMIRKLIGVEVSALADDEVLVVMSTSALARDGHVLEPQGCVLDNYLRNNIWLWSHNPDVPTGNGEDVEIGPTGIRARVKFAPEGISPEADKFNRLVKAGVVKAVSIGFEPIEMEPLDPRKPKGGQRITKWDLLEASWVSVPSDTNALVTARAHGDETMADGIEDANQPSNGKGAPKNRSVKPGNGRVAVVFGERGVYQVADLCYMFESLGYKVDVAKYEAAMEGDGSKVPAMLAAVLHDLGDTILAMAQEEIAEALAGYDCEPEEDEDDEILVVEERMHIRAAKTPRARAFRRGLAQAKIRAGKTLSADSVSCMRDAVACHEEAMSLHRSAIAKHKEGIAAINDMMDRAGVSDPESDATQTVQTSSGTGVDEGSEGQRHAEDFARRQADLTALSPAE